LRILKGNSSDDRTEYAGYVAGISIRLRILKDRSIMSSGNGRLIVAGISIRLRILKAPLPCTQFYLHERCRDIDPVEDTERFGYSVSMFDVPKLQGYRSG